MFMCPSLPLWSFQANAYADQRICESVYEKTFCICTGIIVWPLKVSSTGINETWGAKDKQWWHGKGYFLSWIFWKCSFLNQWHPSQSEDLGNHFPRYPSSLYLLLLLQLRSSMNWINCPGPPPPCHQHFIYAANPYKNMLTKPTHAIHLCLLPIAQVQVCEGQCTLFCLLKSRYLQLLSYTSVLFLFFLFVHI